MKSFPCNAMPCNAKQYLFVLPSLERFLPLFLSPSPCLTLDVPTRNSLTHDSPRTMSTTNNQPPKWFTAKGGDSLYSVVGLDNIVIECALNQPIQPINPNSGGVILIIVGVCIACLVCCFLGASRCGLNLRKKPTKNDEGEGVSGLEMRSVVEALPANGKASPADGKASPAEGKYLFSLRGEGRECKSDNCKGERRKEGEEGRDKLTGPHSAVLPVATEVVVADVHPVSNQKLVGRFFFSFS